MCIVLYMNMKMHEILYRATKSNLIIKNRIFFRNIYRHYFDYYDKYIHNS